MATKGLFHRLFWLCVYVVLVILTLFLVVTLWYQFQAHPTITTLVSSTYLVAQVPFPGVSICSVNKISKKRATDLAWQIANLTRRDPEEMMEYIRFIGQLYDFDSERSSFSKLLEFQNILEKLQMTVAYVARQVATPCEELLKNCYWKNVRVNCSSIFTMRQTHDGYCCVFNYVKLTSETLDYEVNKEPMTTEAGVENGLYVSVNNNLEDYYYTTLSSAGVVIHTFVPTDYPDKPSGSVTEILTQPNSENFVEIVPTTLTSVEDVVSYPIEKRGCFFEYERSTLLGNIYSQSDCHVDCRIVSIQAMCQCIPFMIPFSTNETVCTLADIPCLNRYREKWNSLYPDGDNGPYLDKEKQDSLRCAHKCYPLCEETVYEALANSFPTFNKTQKHNNLTHVYVYYLNRFSKLYRQDVVYYWFEVLSNFGGIFGIFVGWSIISMIQFSFYYAQIFIEKLLK